MNDKLSVQGNIYFRHMERRNYNGDEFEGADCGLRYDRTGAADNTLCGEFETNTDGVEIIRRKGNNN